MFKSNVLLIFVTALLLFAVITAAESREAKVSLSAARKEAVIKEITEALDKSYIFPETAAKIRGHLQNRLKKGDYETLNDPVRFAAAIFEDLRAVGKDLHMGFHYDPAVAAAIKNLQSKSEEEVKKVREQSLAEAKRDNFGFRKVERLKGNIGFLDFRYFASADQAGPTAAAALNFLANSDAIIIDLRQNGGGEPSQVQFISSYFFDQPTHLNDIYTRETNSTEHFWTLPFVPGDKLVKADLYILTSKSTFSGAEEFCYNMKNLKRATLIGEKTGGGAHPNTSKIIQENFVLYLPYARAINPITKTNWEGTGVEPDILVPADQAFDKAYLMALEKLAQKTTDANKKSGLEWTIDVHKAKANPIQLDSATMQRYAGVYEDRKVTIENGALHYQRSGPKYKLIPLNETTFIVDGLDDVRFEFTVKDGKALEIVGVYSDGTREPSRRSS